MGCVCNPSVEDSKVMVAQKQGGKGDTEFWVSEQYECSSYDNHTVPSNLEHFSGYG